MREEVRLGMVVAATTGEVEVGGEVEGTIGVVATAMADKGTTAIFNFVQGKEYSCNFMYLLVEAKFLRLLSS